MPLALSLLVTPVKRFPTARHLLLGALILFSSIGYSTAFADSTEDDAIFLVATEQLHGSSFQQAVILLTHFSNRGATGLTINRPAGISLQQAFPRIRQLLQRTEPLYLGGPVSTNAIFVLLRTLQPSNTMHRIAGDIYFSTGQNAFSRPAEAIANSSTRTYAGYAGWAPGQLQSEIGRGDWLMVHTDPRIIFEEDVKGLWQRLTKRWSGKWI